MFLLCKATEWTHFPCEGGLYDQHPKFLDDMMIILQIQSKIESKKNKETMNKKKPKGGGSRAAGRARS